MQPTIFISADDGSVRIEGDPVVIHSSWDIADARRELASFYRSEKQLGRKFDTGYESFPWGGAWAKFDVKGFMASAGIHYHLHLAPNGVDAGQGG